MLKDCRLFWNGKKNQSEPEKALACKVGSDHHSLCDAALKSYIDQEVLCVDFQLDDGEPSLDLELRSGEMVKQLVDVRPAADGGFVVVSDNPVLMNAELSSLNNIMFQLSELDDSPGVLLKKNGNCTWTPISSRTRSQSTLRHPFTWKTES